MLQNMISTWWTMTSAYFSAPAILLGGRVDIQSILPVAGMVLLVAMIGAIVLTLRHKANVKRQNINVQNARTPEMAMAMRKVASGQGLQDADAAEWVK